MLTDCVGGQLCRLASACLELPVMSGLWKSFSEFRPG